ncbi:MAG TPA: efflux RND transporter permease subunit [Spirochaetota bacterium]|nr:efflux RND transporter permease subunit [Spirochaetota bacterium]
MKILDSAIRRRITTTMAFTGLCLIGAISASRLPVELLPDIELPRLTVITPFENAAPSEIEKLVTSRIEEAVTGVSGVTSVSSESIEGLSIVKITFQWGTDMDMALIEAKEKADLVKCELPEDTGQSIVVKYDPSDDPVMIYSVSLRSGENSSVRRRVEKEIVPFVERINGVSLVDILGGDKREIHIDIDNARLFAHNLSLSDVARRIDLSNYNYPAGSLVKGDMEYQVRTVGEFRNLDDIRNVAAGYNESGIPVYLRDIALIEDTFKERKSIVRFNGVESVALLVRKEPGKNTIDTCGNVRSVIEEIHSKNKDDFNMRCVYDQSQFIQNSIDNVTLDAILGGIISFIILFLFMKRIGPPVIICATIPVSVLGTFILMDVFGISVNTMSLGGLAIGIGMIVDAGTVVLESIYMQHQAGSAVSRMEAAVKGATDVAVPVIVSVLSSVVVFMPIVFLSGLAGALFRDLALTVSFSLFISLIAAVTLIPMLSTVDVKIPAFMKLPGNLRKKFDPVSMTDRLMERLDVIYEHAIRYSLTNRKMVILCGLGSLAAGIILFIPIKSEIMPRLDPGEFSIEIEMPGGTPLAKTESYCAYIEKSLSGISSVDYVFTKAGCDPDATISEKISGHGAEYGIIKVFLKNSWGVSTNDIIEQVKKSIPYGEDAQVVFRLKEDVVASLFSGSGKNFNVEIAGNDIATLREAGKKLKSIVAGHDGARNVSTLFDGESPELRLDINRDSALSLGMNIEDTASSIAMAVKGEIITRLCENDEETDIRIRLAGTDRNDVESIGRIPVMSGTGESIPVSRIAQIIPGSASVKIVRREQSRINIVSADIVSDIDGFIADISSRLAGARINESVTVKIADTGEEITRAMTSMGFALVLAVVFIYMLLAAQFQSFINPLIVMLSIPVTMPGISLAMILTGVTLNINSGIGIIMLSGNVVSSAIMLFDCIEHNRSEGHGIEESLILAGKERLKPIVMTVLTTIVALVPIAIGIGQGSEIQKPLAVTVIGGLTVSTLLTLLFIPSVYYAVYSWRDEK